MNIPKTSSYNPMQLNDWQELLQSLADCIRGFQTNRPQKDKIDAESRAGLIRHYIFDLEYCLSKTSRAIHYYEDLTRNYDRLVSVMEESRNQAYDVIDRLKHEIAIAKKYRPFTDGKEASHE